MSETIEIKSCPFCGGQPEYDEEYGASQVTCPTCKCDGPWKRHQHYAEAIRTWNERAQAPVVPTSQELHEAYLGNGNSAPSRITGIENIRNFLIQRALGHREESENISYTGTTWDGTKMPNTQPAAPPPCFWEEADGGDYWNTTCGNAYTLIAGTPKDNDMKYCTYCGGELYEKGLAALREVKHD